MEGFNNQQGASNRDVEGVKGEGVTMAAAEAEGEGDAHTMRTRTHPEAFPNTSPRWEDPSKFSYPVSTTVALSRLSQGDRQPAEAAAKTQRTQTDSKYSTTGMYVIPTYLMLRMATIEPHAETGRWITRRGSHTKTHKHTLMQDMLQQLGEYIETLLPVNF
jgi:hypothetical protein